MTGPARALSAATELAGVVGFPVRHSLSPRLHNAAYAALGLDWAYLAFEVPPGKLEAAVLGAASLGMRGLSVTMPHKEQAARLASRRSATVRRLGAANTLTFEEDRVVADTTDGDGFLSDVRSSLGFEPAGKCCGVIGAGAAARSVVLALAEAGARELLVVDRTPARALRAATLAGTRGRLARPEELDGADLVVQATPVGMSSADGPVASEPPPGAGGAAGPGWPAGVDPARLGAGQVAVDLVYHPRVTPWLEEASRCGATTRNGLGMLVRQAALQVSRWTGEAAPEEAMWEAVSTELGEPGATLS